MATVPPPPGLLEKVIGKLRQPPAAHGPSGSAGTSGTYGIGAAASAGSLLTLSGAQYGQHTDEDLTEPTGFNPEAAALFEAVIEGAYLVAVADGTFDDIERAAFEHVVLAACDGKVTAAQLRSLLADLADAHDEDGTDRRVRMVARAISRPDQAREVLRIASLIAQVSDGVSAVERAVLDKLAHEFKLDGSAVDVAIAEATRALES